MNILEIHRPVQRALFAALVAVLFATQAPVALSAQGLTSEELDRVNPAAAKAAREAIGMVRSPYCPTMLETCSHPASVPLRDSIRMLAADGWSAERIVDWVAANHGEEYRAMPEPTGRGLVAWIMPFLALTFGAGATVIVLRRLRQANRSDRASSENVMVSDEDEARLKAALRELESSEEPAL